MSRQLGWHEFEPDDPESPTFEPEARPAAGTWTSAVAAPAGTPNPTAAPAGTPKPAPAGTGRQKAAAPPSVRGASRLPELVWLCLAVVNAFLALDFLLRALAATDSSAVGVVITVGNALASPFAGAFQGQTVPHVGHTAFWAALLAVVVYTLAASLLLRLLRVLAGPSTYPRSGTGSANSRRGSAG